MNSARVRLGVGWFAVAAVLTATAAVKAASTKRQESYAGELHGVLMKWEVKRDGAFAVLRF